MGEDPAAAVAGSDEAATRAELLAALAAYEEGTRKRRPYLIAGVVVIVASFSFLSWQLYSQKRDAEQLAIAHWQFALGQWQRADAVQASLREATNALETGERERLGRALEAAQGQTRELGAAVSGQDGDTAVAQIPLEELEVRIWICRGGAAENRSRAIAFSALRPANAGRWRRDYLSIETNARANYRLVRSEIRFNPEEAAAADRLQQLIREEFRIEVAKVVTFYPSPRSVSVFFCDGASPPAADGASPPAT